MSDTENNGSNGSENNTANTPAPETNTPVNTPATETPKQEENKPDSTPSPEPVKSDPAPEPAKEEVKSEGVNYSETAKSDTPEAATTSQDATASDNVIPFTISGESKVDGKVSKGTTIRDAVAKLGGNITNMSLRDANNKTVYGTTVINGPMKLTASTRASGG